MGLAPLFFTIVAGPIIAGTIIAGIFQVFMRESTGIFERWDNKTIEQRAELENRAAEINLNPNIANRDDGPLDPSDNHDGDCMTNGQEEEIGSDPQNPDTDGDGIDDCIDTVGAVVKFEKTVNGEERVTVRQHDVVTFHIHAEIELKESGAYTFVITDELGPNLSFIEGTLTYDSTTIELTSFQSRFEIPLFAAGGHTVDIVFTSEVLACIGDTYNKTTISQIDNPAAPLYDDVSLVIVPDPTRLFINNFTKTVGGKHQINAQPGDLVDFEIRADLTLDTCIEERTFIIEDRLDSGLDFISGFSNADGPSGTTSYPITNWPGRFEYLLDRSGNYQITIRFQAEIRATDLIINTAKGYEKENIFNRREDSVFIIVKDASSLPPLIRFFKAGRVAGTETWQRYIYAEPEDVVQFQILAEVTQDGYSIVDALPPKLPYVPGSLTLYFNDANTNLPEIQLLSLFRPEGLSLNRGPGVYEIRFSATVDSVDPFSLTNTATAKPTDGQSVTETATVISKT